MKHQILIDTLYKEYLCGVIDTSSKEYLYMVPGKFKSL